MLMHVMELICVQSVCTNGCYGYPTLFFIGGQPLYKGTINAKKMLAEPNCYPTGEAMISTTMQGEPHMRACCGEVKMKLRRLKMDHRC